MNNAKLGPTLGPEESFTKAHSDNIPIVVHIIDLEKDEIERTERINYSDSAHRKWLGRITFWAYNHNKSVETMSLEDWEKYDE